ncbi:MAG: CehA/McbA family metallohydrolase [Candidatus Heimdallarchaeaceae archaeon]
MKFDLHIHSKYSPDSKNEPKEIIKMAKKKGLKGIAITDHDTVKFYEKEYEKKGIIIVPGIEISTKKGHIIALGIKEKIEKKLTVEETIEKIKEKGGIAVIAHPFDITRKGIGKEIRKLEKIVVETQNGATMFQKFNEKAKKYAEKNKLPETGGSDAHRIKDIGMAYTETEETIENVEELIEAIRKRKTKGEGTHLTVKEKIIRAFQIHL